MHRWFRNPVGHLYWTQNMMITLALGWQLVRLLDRVHEGWSNCIGFFLNAKLMANQGVEPVGCFRVLGLPPAANPRAAVCNPLGATSFDPGWKRFGGHVLQRSCVFSHQRVLLLPTFWVWVHCLGLSPPLVSWLDKSPLQLVLILVPCRS